MTRCFICHRDSNFHTPEQLDDCCEKIRRIWDLNKK